MAIQFVGGATAGKTGATSGNSTIALNSGLTGGIASAVSDNDLVIAVFASGSTADRTLAITDGTTAYTLIDSELYSDDVFDTNLRVAYKFVSGDTATTFGPTGNAADSGAMAVYVFRGVSTTTTLDVAAVPATGNGTSRADPAGITPSTSGAFTVFVGAAAHNGGVDTFTSGDLTDFLTQGGGNDTNDVTIGIGHIDNWTSGESNPAAFGHSQADSADFSWAAMSIALRPTTGPISGSSSLTFSTTGTLTGAGSLVGESTLTFSITGVLTGAGVLGGSTSFAFTTTATGSATSAIQGSSSLTFTTSGTLLASGRLFGSSDIAFTPQGVLTGAGRLLGSSDFAFTPVGILGGAGVLGGSTSFAFTTQGALGGIAVLVGSTTLTFSLEGNLSDVGGGGTVQISGTSSLTFTPQGALVGSGALTSSTTVIFTPQSTLAGSGRLVGSLDLAFSLSGTGILRTLPYGLSSGTSPDDVYDVSVDAGLFLYYETSGTNPDEIYEED